MGYGNLSRHFCLKLKTIFFGGTFWDREKSVLIILQVRISSLVAAQICPWTYNAHGKKKSGTPSRIKITTSFSSHFSYFQINFFFAQKISFLNHGLAITTGPFVAPALEVGVEVPASLRMATPLMALSLQRVESLKPALIQENSPIKKTLVRKAHHLYSYRPHFLLRLKMCFQKNSRRQGKMIETSNIQYILYMKHHSTTCWSCM